MKIERKQFSSKINVVHSFKKEKKRPFFGELNRNALCYAGNTVICMQSKPPKPGTANVIIIILVGVFLIVKSL